MVNQIGIVVPPGDVEGTIQAVLKLAASSKLCNELGKKGREMVGNQWDIKVVLNELTTRFTESLSHSNYNYPE